MAAAFLAAVAARAHDGIHAPDNAPYVAVPHQNVIEQYARQSGIADPSVRRDGNIFIVTGKMAGVAGTYHVDGRSLAVEAVGGAPTPRMPPIRRLPPAPGAAIVSDRLMPAPLPGHRPAGQARRVAISPYDDRGIRRAMQLLDQLGAALGRSGLLTGSDMAGYERDWRGLYEGHAAGVLRPADTAQVAEVVRLCAAAGASIVPQGGNTSMVGGAAPDASGQQFVLSLSRLNRVRELDAADMSITLEAGLTLKAAQEAAEAAGLMLPLSINAEGSATIGGVLATNAGGNLTVRYGNARDLVLGLEVVLADGSVFEGLRRLRKDNTGYCLRQLFVGSEGTLGIITAAVLKLVAGPRQREVALCALPSAEAALALFGRFQRHDPGAVQAFEYMSATGMELVNSLIAGASLPFAETAPHYVLVELASPREGGDLRAGLETVLEAAIEAEEVLDAVLAESEAQRLALWQLREEHSEAQKRAGASVKNDVSVPVSRIPAFLAEATAVCAALVPGIRVAPFGHIGDGNIHFNLVQPEGADAAGFLARDHALMDAVGEVVQRFDGSFSAEHGVGRLKPYMMPLWRGGAELAAMQAIKQALDPQRLLNPHVMLPS